MKTSLCRSRLGIITLYLAVLLSMPTGTYSRQIMLLIQSDIRARGMGEAAAALPDNPMGFMTDPACLAQSSTAFARFSYAEWLPGFDDEPATYAVAAGFLPDRLVNFGAAIQRYDYPTITYTDETGNIIARVDPYDRAIVLGYAAAPTYWLSAGLNIKYVTVYAPFRPNGLDATTSTLGFDFGLLLHDLLTHLTFGDNRFDFDPESGGLIGLLKQHAYPRSRGLSFGIALQHVGPNLTPEGTSREIPLPHTLRVGFAWRLVDIDPLGVLIAADASRLVFMGGGKIYRHIDYNVGMETCLLRFVTVRAGYIAKPEALPNCFTLGLSAGFDKIHFDLSYIPQAGYEAFLGEVLFFGLTMNL